MVRLSLYLIFTIIMGNPGEKQDVALGGSLHIVPALATRASPIIAIALQKVDKNPENEGVVGMPSLGCLPLWGREGVILQIAGENKRMT
jgi:hypothetical protein